MKFKKFLQKTRAKEAMLPFHFEGSKSIYKRLVLKTKSFKQTTWDSSPAVRSKTGSTKPHEFLRVYYYTVKPGDTYWTIANRLYGDSHQWKYVYEANKKKMRHPDNPNLIFPGMVLDIPDIPRDFYAKQ
ncbi:MAG: LysM peptidoglycan-binding domain-containing protein [Treponema sp.]|jgi:nucleoid-associated protein YgaU|nr:LysM peptidoglycan-binding domain-containing protein [Treponema sp.]